MDAKRFNILLGNIRNESACTALYDFYYPKIVNHIAFRFGGRELGEDVAQEFFMKLCEMTVTYYVKSPVSWIYAICDNIARDFLEKERKYALAYRTEETDFFRDDAFANLVLGEFKEGLKNLDAETREIIVMKWYEGYDLKEIADKLKLNYNTVRQKYSRGMKKLKIR